MEYKGILLPDKLTPETKRYITKVIDSLTASDNLRDIDEGVLYILAESHNKYIKASEILDKEGYTVVSRGAQVMHPCVKIVKDNKSVCLSIMETMGLTIKARKKINLIDNETEQSPLEKFFTGGGGEKK